MPFRSLPTTYAGVKFRSRLEARWAVFFDALQLRWEYEPEGVLLESGGYFPDFKIRDNVPDDRGQAHDFGRWIEVKGDASQLTPTYLAKLGELALASRPVVILGGVPDWRWFGRRTPVFCEVRDRSDLGAVTIWREGFVYQGWWSEGRPLLEVGEGSDLCPQDVRDALDRSRNERFQLFPGRTP